ncbi:NAD-dependent succinate-semialdehyde dehydrogenase [Devosia sp. Root685]|uniref:NAD-dependent succinate-semialdehyde dehydrogenase n=1 Tax=Devosia sp. Root685 TaxID=1736587 RepID=UPI0006FADA98|nr:NAD-dependent succinate-semialdehyde dehydrogenase [Devosia sp. Root685]KRA99826.1 NAD-dependent succinate-semialdehyde dehydrogenase [Devosia sp. Root685]
MYIQPKLFIGGSARLPRDTPVFNVINPANEAVLGSVASAGSQDVADALRAAEAGQGIWAAASPWERSAVLRRVSALIHERRQSIATTITLETGKPLAESLAEVQNAADHFDWCADEARRVYGQTVEGRGPNSRFDIRREPVGVVLALTAWNFPLSLPARKLASGLAAGCAIILRPASEAPASAAALVACCHDAGVPAGVVNLLFGEPDAVIAPLIASPKVRKVSFTGSTHVGQILIRQCADTLKRLTMELGGHAPFIVLDDADVDAAAKVAVASKFRNAGQVCTAPSRFYVHEAVIDHFTERFVTGTQAIRLGDGLAPDTDMGPQISPRQRERAERLVADAVGKGAHIAAGGRRPDGRNRGYFFEPTVLVDIPQDAQVLSEEPFTPIAAIVPIQSADDAIARANGLEYGLAAYLFGRSERQLDHVASKLEAGMVGVNTAMVSTAEAPFGGIKASGSGREGGSEGITDYLNTKFIHRQSA